VAILAERAVPRLRMNVLRRVLGAAKRIEEEDGKITASKLVKRSGVSSKTLYRYLKILEERGWAERVRSGEYRPIIIHWDRIPRAYVEEPAISSEDIGLVRDTLLEIKLMALIYGNKRLIGTHFSNMTFRTFVRKYRLDITRILHKIVFREPLTEKELTIFEALISFAHSFKDLGTILISITGFISAEKIQKFLKSKGR